VRAPENRRPPKRGYERFRDEEVAESIIGELRRHDPAIDKSRAIDHVKSCLAGLRTFARKAGTEPRPSTAKKTVAQIGAHAEALAVCIEKLSPNWRFAFSWVFYRRGEGGSLVLSKGSDLAAESRMNDWISDLKKIPHDFGQMRNSPHNFFAGPKVECAFAARGIILASLPAMKLTKGDTSSFYLITSWLWYAISEEKDKSMKRSCDRVIDLIAAMERPAPAVSDAGD
jgi:hypothetical protein